MKTCATCRFMAEKRELYDLFEVVTEHRTCARIIHGNSHAKIDDDQRVKTEPALVTDGSGYAARLVVLPTFGCVLHEERT